MSSTYRVNEIDLLRFLSALAVLFYHYAFRGYFADNLSMLSYPHLESVAKYGNYGVTLFFMISGFVILMTATNNDLRHFIISRLSRLYPAFWICCTLTFITAYFIGGDKFNISGYQYIINMTMLPMSFFSMDYYVDGVYWSLFMEIHFYCLIALVIFFNKMDKIELILTGWMILTIILFFIPSGYLNYIFLTALSSYFIAGATFFLIWKNGLSLLRCELIVISFLWSIFINYNLNSLQAAYYQTNFNPYVIIAIISSFFIIMMLIALKKTGIFAYLRWTSLGALTYPLYLLHQNIGYMVFNQWYDRVNPHILFWATTSFMIILSWLICRYTEKPLMLFLKRVLSNYWPTPKKAEATKL